MSKTKEEKPKAPDRHKGIGKLVRMPADYWESLERRKELGGESVNEQIRELVRVHILDKRTG